MPRLPIPSKAPGYGYLRLKIQMMFGWLRPHLSCVHPLAHQLRLDSTVYCLDCGLKLKNLSRDDVDPEGV